MADNDSRAGAGYTRPDILRYLAEVHVADKGAFAEAFAAPDRHGMPAIQVGPSEAKTLGMLLRLIGARKVVEVGTLAGYSALHMARALPEGGKLWSLELEQAHAEVARQNVRGAGLSDRVEVLVGPALETLSSLTSQGPFDAVFIDADKGHYAEYGVWAADNLRPGGLLLADNAFFFGQLLSDSPDAASVRALHEQSRTAFDTVCIPTPDGLLMGLRR